ncbi:MAG TPA: type IV toxin-antitoxin system AbiEi family antitoxin domain-containing protein [Mycobacteriales bacterium]|nr:type IV toxin-antitoxin system AbiEi family antitoxin domain-containing protein [Mycobacteriales bacterium]
MSLDVARAAARSTGGVLTTRQLAVAGINRHRIRSLIRRGTLARLARGVYVIGDEVLPDPARVAAVFDGVLSYESMLAWMNVDLPVPPSAVHVTVPRDRKRTKAAEPGVQCYRAPISQVCESRGVRMLPPTRVAVDIARNRALAYAVAVVDAMMRAGLIGLHEFRAAAAAAHGPGSKQVRLVARLVDPKAESVLESYCRVLLWQHGLLPERTQYNLQHPRTGWVGRLDFAWPSLRIAVEADGYATHRDRYRKDRRRWTAINRAGWLLAVVTWEDVVHDPDYVVQAVRDLFTARAESARAESARAESARAESAVAA